jgi:pepF/M3 family oligoendopeptidase
LEVDMSEPSADAEPDPLPRWDLDSLYPGPESPEFRAALDGAARRIADLTALFDRHGVGVRSPESGAAAIPAFEQIVAKYDAALAQAYLLDGYLSCLTAADTQDVAAGAAASGWREIRSGLAALAPRFVAWVSVCDRAALVAGSVVARDHEPVLQRLQIAAAHLMPPGEEELAALLGPSGATAWMTLSEATLSQAVGVVEFDGEARELPLSEIENLAFHPDRAVRQRGQETTRATQRALGTPLAAAINGVKGQQLALSRRRGWDDPLDQALFANAIDHEILNAMFGAMRQAVPDYQRYLRAKARALRLPRLAGYDLLAPVGESAVWPFDAARDFIVATFAAFAPALGAFAERAFAERWLDVGPRLGKTGGAFCTGVGGDASRILLNYVPVSTWMTTTAHELGHAYHNFVIHQKGRTFLQASPDYGPLPMPLTLAETASTLCEILALRAAASAVQSDNQVAALDEWLQGFTLSTFGVMPAFAFERRFFATRAQRELAPAEMEVAMGAAWTEVTGDAVDSDTAWSESWTMSHFIGDTIWYYNFPYAFGMLFALGLLAERDAAPDTFLDRFDTLLADSGMREARDLAAAFGIDLTAPAFWGAAFDEFRADVDRYEALVG